MTTSSSDHYCKHQYLDFFQSPNYGILGTISLKCLGIKMAPSLVCFILEQELLDLYITTPILLQHLGGKMALKLVYFVLKHEPLYSSETAT